MDAVKFLIKQHREMEELLHQVMDCNDLNKKQTLFTRCADHLTLHITSEEQIFYPAVRVRRTEDILLESLEEHLSLKRLLADLLELDLADQTFPPKFKVLQEQAEHHHKEEEEHLFPKVEKLLDANERGALGQKMEALQEQLCAAGKPRKAVAEQTEAAAPLE